MKNVISKVFMTSAILASLLLPAVSASADATTPTTTGKTNVSATFTAGDTAVTPVDPTDPSKPGTDGNNGAETGSGTGLSLIYVTNTLGFGSHAIDVVKSNDYAVDAATSKLWNNKAVVQVSDTRGTNAGWNLSVSGDQFANGADKLTGATLSLPAGSVTNASGATTGNATAQAAAAYQLDGSGVSVLNAAAGNGSGITIDQLDPTNIKLTVPANTAKATSYTTTLNWTLADTATK